MILFIHRKDLRIEDMTAFDYFYRAQMQSVHILILDPFLLRNNRQDAHSGVNFLRHVVRLQQLYLDAGKQLHVLYGEPTQVVSTILEKVNCSEIIVHQDFTPYAITRDRNLKLIAEQFRVPYTRLMDHALVDFAGFQQYASRTTAYQVYTPFYRKWHDYIDLHRPEVSAISLHDLNTVLLAPEIVEAYPLPFLLKNQHPADHPSSALTHFLQNRLAPYATVRDQFAVPGTSELSKHINAGAISIRQIYQAAYGCPHSESWIRQLAWRDFYLYQSIYNPDYFTYEKKYDFSLLTDQFFEAWAHAQTGIPIIDAAMTELNETGNMPNRLRMVTAMFLTKNLRCPFTYGEKYFRLMLTDYDNTLNRGGWLWSSSLGYDAAPYFRIMNPVTQSQTHDPTGSYIRKWLPEMNHLSDKEIHLPRSQAIVDLSASRQQAIAVYKQMLSAGRSEQL
jgi:deoxyribodipyrimidine photo-lyase